MPKKARFVLKNLVDSATMYSYTLTNNIDTVNINVGIVTAATAGTSGFTVSTTIVGDATTAEETNILTVNASALVGTYFTISSTLTDFYIWYEVDGAGIDPSPGILVGLKVQILSTYTDIEVANATHIVLAKRSLDFLVNDGTKTTLPLKNLTNSSRSKDMRTIDSTDFEIYGSLSGVQAISSIVFGRHNFSLYSRYRIRLYSDEDLLIDSGVNKTLIYDSGMQIVLDIDETSTELVGWGDFLWPDPLNPLASDHPWGADQTAVDDPFDPPSNLALWLSALQNNVRAFKITLSVDADVQLNLYANTGTINCNNGTIQCNDLTTTVSTYPFSGAINYQIGRLFLSNYIEVTYNISFGHTLEWVESTKQYRTDSGSLRSDAGIPYRKLEFSLNTIPEADRPTLQHGFRTVGKREDFFVSLFPEDSSNDKRLDYSGIMKLTRTPKFIEFSDNYYKSKYVMEEV